MVLVCKFTRFAKLGNSLLGLGTALEGYVYDFTTVIPLLSSFFTFLLFTFFIYRFFLAEFVLYFLYSAFAS